MALSIPSVIFFDLDDTLLDHEGSEKRAALRLREEYGLEKWSPNAFLHQWEALSNEHIATYFSGLITFQEQRRRRIRAIFEDASIPDEEADAIFETYLQAYEATWALFADAIPCLDALNGMRLGMISNGNSDQQRRKLKATKIDQRFETVVISSEVGIAKPDAGIFHEACRQMNVNPSDCIMVGDNWDRDVLGARLAGLRAIWLCRDREMLGNQAGIASLYELSVNLAV